MRELHGERDLGDARVAVVVARFNERVTDGLLAGALRTLARRGVPDDAITVVRVAGAFEIPQVLSWFGARGDKPDAMIALGAIVRGETPHFDHLAAAVTNAIERVALSTGVPIANGVITCDTPHQAEARSSEGGKNRGAEAAEAVLELAGLARRLRGR